MTAPMDLELFERHLAQETGAWADAKRDAFARLCEAFPDPGGPPAEGLRQLRRGSFDARVPREWRPVFLEVYHQWLGFAAEQDALRPAPLLSPAWWLETQGPLRSLPRWTWPLFSPGALLALALLCTAGFTMIDVRLNAAAEARLRTLVTTTSMADEDLAAAEKLALASLAGGSDQVIASYLAAEGSLRSRYDAARQERERLAAALDSVGN